MGHESHDHVLPHVFLKPVLPTYFHEVFPGACLGLQMDQPAEFFETISKRFGTSWPNNTPNLVSEVKVSRLAMFIGSSGSVFQVFQ